MLKIASCICRLNKDVSMAFNVIFVLHLSVVPEMERLFSIKVALRQQLLVLVIDSCPLFFVHYLED